MGSSRRAAYAEDRPFRDPSGWKLSDEPVVLNVLEELETVPGVEQAPLDVEFYSREYPLESPHVQNTGDDAFGLSIWSGETLEDYKTWFRENLPFILEAKHSGDIEPTARPTPGRDVTAEIKAKARELGFRRGGCHQIRQAVRL